MKLMVFLSIVFLGMGALAQNNDSVDRGEMSQELLEKALANPRRFHFDDGGNIDFGNGFFKRRVGFDGQPNVCHDGTYMYGGTGKKCMLWVAKKKCGRKETFQLISKMQGKKMICNDREDVDSFRCDKPSYIKYNRGPVVKVKVYQKNKGGSKGKGKYIGYTRVTLPRCQEL